MKYLLCLALSCLSINAYADASSATAIAHHQVGSHGYAFSVYTFHSVHLVNNEQTPQNMTYTYTICVNYQHCKSLSNTVTLAPGQVFDDPNGRMMTNEKFDYAGTYQIRARTEVFGNPHYEAVNYNTLQVW